MVPGSQRRPDNRAWAIGLASGGWLKLILLRVSQESPKVAVWGADRPFEHLHTSSTADQTYPKTDTGPNDDNGTAGATGLGLYVCLTRPKQQLSQNHVDRLYTGKGGGTNARVDKQL